MQSQSRSNPHYFPNYPQYSNHNNRPQTSYSPNINKSHTRLSSHTQNYNPAAFNRSIASHSRMQLGQSRASHLSSIINQGEVFPDDMVFLLRNQEKNINLMKQKIEREKGKVENDFAVFRTQIDHILQDVKLSVQAQLDLIYKTYITKYAQLKGQVQQLRMLRKQILANNHAVFSNSIGAVSTSNKNLIQEIEKDAQHIRNFKIYGYLGEIQKQKLEPILELSDQLILFGSLQASFYRNKELTLKLKQVKNDFGSLIKEVFDNLAVYVATPELLIQKVEHSTIPHDLDMQSSKYGEGNYSSHFRAGENNAVNRDLKQSVKQGQVRISSNQQSCVTKWCEEMKLNQIERVKTDHTDSILCIYFVNDQHIATGSKDATINIYTIEGGKKVRKLKGHQASICCLSTFRNINGDTFLASGSDHGCSSLMLWDVRSWTAANRIQSHLAAVTGIIDLQDGRHIATGSYDKKISVYSIVKNQIVLNLSNNKTSVTGMVMTADKSRLITSGLDKTILTWSIRRKHGVVEQIVHQKVIVASELICQLQPSQLRPDLIFGGARDGSLKIINVISGKQEKSLSVSPNSLIQLVAIERELTPDAPILIACSAKDTSLKFARMDNGVSTAIKLPTNVGIDYGCGIGPKIVMNASSSGIMAIANQQAGSAQFSLYEMILK